MDILKTLDECKVFADDGLGTGKLEVRLTEMLPGYSMVICNPSKPSGQMTVEYLGYRSYLNERPHIELDASTNMISFGSQPFLTSLKVSEYDIKNQRTDKENFMYKEML